MDTHERSDRTGYLIAIVGAVLLINLVFGSSFLGTLVSAALFAITGLVFVAIHQTNSEHWWALIPGLTLLGLSLATLVSQLGGALFLGAIGLGFALVYRSDREHWWALIPAGTLFTLALISAGAAIPFSGDGGGLLFLGLALTFGTVWRQAGQEWAIWPMGAMVFMTLLIVGSSLFALTSSLLPLVLIGAGLWWLFGDQTEASA